MINQFVYPLFFSCAILFTIVIKSITIVISCLFPMLNHIYHTLNNLSCDTVIYIHCVLSTCTTAAICYLMVQKHNEELEAMMKEQNIMEIVKKDTEPEIVEDELDATVREALDRIADLGLFNDLRRGLNKFIRHISNPVHIVL